MGSELTTARRPFLTARWQHLCLLNYAVDPARLQPRLPEGLELDTLAGEAYMSLVAFDFLDTRVLGIPWPFYRNFPEINLRFYVRDTHAVTDVQLDWDWGAVYGPEWSDHNDVAPRSTFLAVGSEIAVAPKRVLGA